MDFQTAKTIIDILDANNESLETILYNFKRLIENKVIAIQGISLLFLDGFLSFKQQISALFIIYSEATVDKIEKHPYFFIFKNLENKFTKASFTSPQLKSILRNILDCNVFGVDTTSQPIEIVNYNGNFSKNSPKNVNSDFNDTLIERLSPVFSTDKIDVSLPKISHKEALYRILSAPGYFDSLSINNFMNIPPPSEVFENELFPVTFDITPDFLFDPNSNEEVKVKVNLILEKALITKSKIKAPELEYFKNALENDPTVVDINEAFSQFNILVESHCELAKAIIHANIENSSEFISEKILALEVNINSINIVSDFLLYNMDENSSEELKLNKSVFLQKYVEKINIIREKKGKTSEKNRKIQMILKLIQNMNQQGVWFSKDLVSKIKMICEEEKKNASTKDDAVKLLDILC